ncbi:hypothetical protein Dshi_3061 [Dinoroseobacter shibae DFL 12 = DSM 16493]|jgi:hypothetical protein|uniref:Lipoprotein n=1 Tax=Dinoroseobacter shibae (strain DSM 16493 / NCIMB 14021 / DFL 12) TaxID=398580 RepID=A8LL45_DINSH|nr:MULTISPECIES: hypothetical protein [Dinoroseobacter]ABV94794.1 hypothetical protein Dshi_3061 [Dinoroseobacter shibae DFL 12 = DSM 16493]MDD9716763.1 hypothetical protein [Dinoroseobacter sp. PD6]URF46214.1 hypothetical protein M8008_15755 [Dinoroseobacter shibae]URF50521.1 hypothetical protein M8007_15755 [Dinoroseobacter shibae]
MSLTKACLAAALCLALAGCNVTNPRVGAGVSIGTDGVNVSPYAGVSLGRARVGIGL